MRSRIRVDATKPGGMPPAHELQPEQAWVHSSVICVSQFLPTMMNTQHSRNISVGIANTPSRSNPLYVHTPPTAIHGALRIGYISPDFHDHVVARNLVPLFQHHDREHFEILCYADGGQTDPLTDIFRRTASQWRSTYRVADEAVAEIIRQIVWIFSSISHNTSPATGCWCSPAGPRRCRSALPGIPRAQASRPLLSDQRSVSGGGSRRRASNTQHPTSNTQQLPPLHHGPVAKPPVTPKIRCPESDTASERSSCSIVLVL